MPATGAIAGNEGQGVTAGSNREAFQNMINEHIARFHREVVDEIVRLAEKHPNIRIVLGGEERSAHAVQKMLPERLAAFVVGVLPIPFHLSQQQVLPQGVWLPGHLTGVGVGLVGRLAASLSPSSRTLPVSAAPPKPSSPLSTERRLLPPASALTKESNLRASIPKPPDVIAPWMLGERIQLSMTELPGS